MSGLTIPMPETISRLASKVNCGDDVAGKFLHEFSTVMGQGLAADGIVTIDGLGTFKRVTGMDGTVTVDFAPETSLAEAVNEPFAIFEPVELAESLTEEELAMKKPVPPVVQSPQDVQSPHDVPPPLPDRFANRPTPTETSTPETSTASETTKTPEDTPKTPEALHQAPISPAYPTQVIQAQVTQSYDTPVPVRLEPESQVSIKRVGHTTLTLVVTAIAACLLGLVAGYMIYRYTNFGLPGNVEIVEEGILIRHDQNNPEKMVAKDTEKVIPADTTTIQPAEPTEPKESVVTAEPEVVTDTVRPGNYLSVMARRHYGNSKFWVYIYLENKDQIRNPDNLEDGMVLTIPPRAKYDIDPESKESLKKADREAYRVMQQQTE